MILYDLQLSSILPKQRVQFSFSSWACPWTGWCHCPLSPWRLCVEMAAVSSSLDDICVKSSHSIDLFPQHTYVSVQLSRCKPTSRTRVWSFNHPSSSVVIFQRCCFSFLFTPVAPTFEFHAPRQLPLMDFYRAGKKKEQRKTRHVCVPGSLFSSVEDGMRHSCGVCLFVCPGTVVSSMFL